MAPPDNRSVSELFGDALGQFSKLVRAELQLARAEIALKAKQAITGVELLAAAAVVLIPTFVVLMIGIASLLVENGMKSSTANFLAGGLGLVVAVVLFYAGTARLNANRLVPEKTINQLQQDAAAVKEQV